MGENCCRLDYREVPVSTALQSLDRAVILANTGSLSTHSACEPACELGPCLANNIYLHKYRGHEQQLLSPVPGPAAVQRQWH
eukprot:6979-Heterococcus_DN1.PRE.1